MQEKTPWAATRTRPIVGKLDAPEKKENLEASKRTAPRAVLLYVRGGAAGKKKSAGQST